HKSAHKRTMVPCNESTKLASARRSRVSRIRIEATSTPQSKGFDGGLTLPQRLLRRTRTPSGTSAARLPRCDRHKVPPGDSGAGAVSAEFSFRQAPEIVSVQVQQIEGEEQAFPSSEQQIIEDGPA